MTFVNDVNRSVMMVEGVRPSKEMIDFFLMRTKSHIDRVKKNMMKMVGHGGLRSDELFLRANDHDESKYGELEFEPYVWLTWMHRRKNQGLGFKYPDGMEEIVDEACIAHVKANKHHPEAHDDINDMTLMDIVEMVCDWTAMSQELDQDGGSAKGWADKKVGVKWKFNDEKTDMIYSAIDSLDKRNGIKQWGPVL